MNITIFCGGSGSENIQRGFYELFGDHVNINLIINGYDDGKSTGAVRHVFDQSILGPSDLRKNHLLKHKLKYNITPLYDILNHRFTCQDPYNYVLNYIKSKNIEKQTEETLLFYVNEFFKYSIPKNISYDDFNIGNIIYSVLFFKEGYEITNKIMCNMLGISNTTFYQSNEALILKAITQNNKILETEEQIVNFKSTTDKIIDIYLVDKNNNKKIPTLENNVIDIIEKSDMIIFSSGTQWSSLIPTYISNDFNKIIQKCKCPKYLFININEDNDMINVSSTEMISILEKYLNLNDITLVFANNSKLNVPSNIKYSYFLLHDIIDNNKHKPVETIIQLMKYHFQKYLKYNSYIFDYDYTLFDPNNKTLSDLIFNELQKLDSRKYILSNNHYSNIQEKYFKESLLTITNFGSYNCGEKSFIDSSYKLSQNEKEIIYNIIKNITLENVEIENIKIEDRNTSICIKPLTNRDDFVSYFNTLLPEKLISIKTGKTSVEIINKKASKVNGYKYIINTDANINETYLYISDYDDLPIDVPKWTNANLNSVYMFLRVMNLFKPVHNLIVIAGGTNSRMNISSPKGLMKINNISVIDNIYLKSKKYINKMYVLTTDKYYNMYNSPNYITINCGNTTSGNGETLMLGLEKIRQHISPYSIVCWSDAVFYDSNIFKELTNSYELFLIPVKMEKNPYAYIIPDEKNQSVIDIKYMNNDPIPFGFHDMSAFQVNINDLNNILLQYKDNYSEYNLLYLIKDMYKNNMPAKYYLTQSDVRSFNTLDEFNSLNISL